MSLVDGPTGRELARDELSDAVYADAQPSLLERAMGWLTEHVDAWLAVADEVPGGHWLLAAAATALVGFTVWLALKWHRAPPLRNSRIFDTAEPDSAATFHAAANQHYQACEWESALIDATRAIVIELQEQGLVPLGPGVTITEVCDAVDDPDVQLTLSVFEEVRYGGRECSAVQAQSAVLLASRVSRSVKVR